MANEVNSPNNSTAQRIADDVPCTACGYSLRGLKPTSECPECGTPAVHSLRTNLLESRPPAYLRRLQIGIRLIRLGYVSLLSLMGGATIGGITFALLFSVGSERLLVSFFALCVVFGCVITGLVLPLGWWLLTERDPLHTMNDPGFHRRVAARTCLVFAAITFWIAVFGVTATLLGVRVSPRVASVMQGSLGLATVVAVFLWWSAGMRHLMDLAKQSGRQGIRGEAVGALKILLWLAGISGFGVVLFVISTIFPTTAVGFGYFYLALGMVFCFLLIGFSALFLVSTDRLRLAIDDARRVALKSQESATQPVNT